MTSLFARTRACLGLLLLTSLLAVAPATLRAPGSMASASGSAAISGAISLPDGSAPIDARVGIYRFENVMGMFQRWQMVQTTSVLGGRYAFTGLQGGTYRVCYAQNLWAPSECLGDWQIDYATDIALADGINTVRDITLAPSGSLATTTTLADGTPTGGRTRLYRVSPGRAPVLQIDAPHTATAPQRFEHLPVGTYRLCFEAAGALNECLGGSTEKWATSISIGAGQDVTRAFQFRPTGSISGSVTINGVRAAKAQLGLQVKAPDGTFEYVQWSQTSAGGTYSVAAAWSGTHRVCVVDSVRRTLCGSPFEIRAGSAVVADLTVRTPAPAVVAPKPPTTITVVKAPTIYGKARVGKKVKVKVGVYSPSSARIRMQWRANGRKIAKATKSTFKVTAKQRGKKLTVRVVVSAPGRTTRVLVSKPVRVR